MRAGLVERVANPDDKRSSYARITPAGRSRLRAAAPTYLAGIERHFTSHLTATEAATVFAGQSAPDNEAMARAVFALALLAQGRQGPAAREIERAQALVKSPQHVLARMPVMIAAARISAAGDPAAALASLESIRAESVKRGIARSEFDARRAMANIEGRRSLSAGARLLDTLRQDAKARGFGLYAR